MSTKIPVLINAFNRPDTTRRVFEVVRSVKPEHLFLALDGPRKDNIDDKIKSEEIKIIFSKVDWKCNVMRLYRNENLGCSVAVPGAISWFFKHVNSGVILEDDCFPDPTFFHFCEILLKRFESEDKVMMISGDNFISEGHFSKHSYFFSKYGFIWGWATWKRAWEKYDNSMKTYPSYIKSKEFKNRYPNLLDRFFWKTGFKNKYLGYSQAWAMKWNYAMSYNSGLCVIPIVNLVENVGFGPDATITKVGGSEMSVPRSSISFPLLHPGSIEENKHYDSGVFKRNFLSTVNLDSIYRNFKNVIKSKY